ncbi:MAG: hypothetical protein M1834_007072 [Cirrosporium novae-zelandiae]|nr:MAG: hypothetical protein M1834_007072 [Cirrosporium novae-zelandiae]
MAESTTTTGKRPESSQDTVDIEKQQEKTTETEKLDSFHNDPPVKDSNEIDWDGPDDPANPRNWSTWRKVTTMAIVASISFLTPLASSMFAPGVSSLMSDFHNTNNELASFVVSAYLLGFAFGPLLIAPMSELYGRTPVYIISNIVALGFTVGCATAPNIGSFIFFRIMAGMGGSAPMSLGGGVIADIFVREKRGVAMALFALGPLLGPVIGPIAGGFLSQAKGWRWVFWVLTILLGVVAILLIICLKETYAPVLLERKTKRLIKETGNTSLRPKYSTPGSPKQLFWLAIKRPIKMLIFDPIILILALYLAIIFGYLYLLFTTFSQVYTTQYHFSEGTVGLAYIGIGIGCMVGVIVVGITSDKILVKLTKKHGEARPEFRLPPMIFLSWTLPVGLFWYGWTADKGVHWIVPIIGTSFFGIGFFSVMMPVQTYLVDAYQLYAASALAANTVLRSLIGAVLPLAGLPMYKSLGIGWGTSLLGFIAMLFLPFPWLFFRYGGQIRKRFARTY